MTDAQTPRPVHVRTIRVEVAPAGPHELDVTATLVDERPGDNPEWFGSTPPPVIHDMRLGLRVRHPDLVITAVRSEMASHPYTICPEALPPLGQLVGLSIARGFTREVNERFGRQRGCAHAAQRRQVGARNDHAQIGGWLICEQAGGAGGTRL